VINDQPYDKRGSLARVDHHVFAEFVDFIAMYAEIRNKFVHHLRQDDLVHYLCVLKGNHG
jgi:hypothetical protein